MKRRILTTTKELEKAADILSRGDLVAVPTETVYGLAADAGNDSAVELIFRTKGRPSFNPLICHVSGVPMASRLVEISPLAKRLMEKFWPGSLTIVLPAKRNAPVSSRVSAGLPTLAVRCPKGPFRDLIEILDRPVAAPSANRSGKISSTSYQAVLEEFPKESFPIIDDGPCPLGLESTIVKVEDDEVTLLRPGAFLEQDLIDLTGKGWKLTSSNSKIQAPGMLTSHYAPKAKVLLDVELLQAKEIISNLAPNESVGLLDFGERFVSLVGQEESESVLRIELSESKNLEEVARNLYQGLRSLDKENVEQILVPQIPDVGLGKAINDRLRRAAAQ